MTVVDINEELITAKKFKVNGKYTNERSAKHEEIIYLKISKTEYKENPFALLTGGGSGAGKSTIIKNFVAPELSALTDSSDFVYIDSDEIKAHITEFKMYSESEDKNTLFLAAFYVHEESTDIVNMLIEACISNRLSFIYDGTMQWKPQYDELIPKLILNGYEVNGLYVDVDVEEAVKRVKIRGAKEKRFVPEYIVRKANRNSAINFAQLEVHFNSVRMYNNSSENKNNVDILPFYKRNYPSTTPFEGEILNREDFDTFIQKSKMEYIK